MSAPADKQKEATVAALRRGDETPFAVLVDRHSPAMVRVAMAYVPTRAAAEEVVQETWIAVMRGIDGFEGRSSLKTWIFRILTHIAMRAGSRERRSVPFADLAAAEDTGEPAVDPDRFLPADHERYPGHWAAMPTRWPTPEDGLLAGEAREVIAKAITGLPKAQRTVITLRDVEGWSSEEVREALEISAGNQRVLLHRARARVRAAIEDYYDAVERIDFEAVPRDELPVLPEGDPACREMVELVTEYLEGALPEDGAKRLERHLETCPSCTQYVEQMGALASGSLRGIADESA